MSVQTCECMPVHLCISYLFSWSVVRSVDKSVGWLIGWLGLCSSMGAQVQKMQAVAKAEAERKAAEDKAAAEAKAREDAKHKKQEAEAAERKKKEEEEVRCSASTTPTFPPSVSSIVHLPSGLGPISALQLPVSVFVYQRPRCVQPGLPKGTGGDWKWAHGRWAHSFPAKIRCAC